ncbi:hypothetical protein ACLKA6_002109 [Drosophila palustris]
MTLSIMAKMVANSFWPTRCRFNGRQPSLLPQNMAQPTTATQRNSNGQQQRRQDCRICANKKFGKQSWRHKTVTATATATATATTTSTTNCGVRTQKLVASYLSVPHFLPHNPHVVAANLISSSSTSQP